MKLPWLKFSPVDWRSDPRLRMCSLAARGLWIDLICYMHEGEPYGHLTIDGVKPTLPEIAGLVGRPERETERAMGELIARKVIACNDAGVLFSRRMVRDRIRSDEGREHVNKRWANGHPNSDPNRSDDRGTSDDPNTKKLEVRIQRSERKKVSMGAVADATRSANSDFERFWKAYPSRGKSRNPKAPARKKFDLIVASDVPVEAIIGGAERYAEAMRDTKKLGTEFVAQAVTWLNQGSWDDYPSAMEIAVAALGHYATADSEELAAWDAHLMATKGRTSARDRNGGWRFPSQWPPGHEGKDASGKAENSAGIPSREDAADGPHESPAGAPERIGAGGEPAAQEGIPPAGGFTI